MCVVRVFLAIAGTTPMLLLLITLIISRVYACLWRARIDGTGGDTGSDVAIDSNGNVIFIGTYQSPVLSIYSSDGTANASATLLNNEPTLTEEEEIIFNDAAFITKYSPDGAHLWSTRIDGPSSESGYRVATDAQGHVFVFGVHESSPASIYRPSPQASSNSDPSATLTKYSNWRDAYIVKYSPAGEYMWSANVASNSSIYLADMGIDAAGNVIVAGSYSSMGLIFDATANPAATPPPAVATMRLGINLAVFSIKFNSNGCYLWSTTSDGSSNDYPHAIAIDSEANVIVTVSNLPIQLFNHARDPAGQYRLLLRLSHQVLIVWITFMGFTHRWQQFSL